MKTNRTLILIAAFWGLTNLTFAADRRWVGKNSDNTLWSTASNWSPDGAPQSGERLVFSGEPHFDYEKSTVNDMTGLVVSMFIWGDYTISGNTLSLTNS